MDPVKRLMEEYGVSKSVAQAAWDACCDGNYLSQCDALSEVDDEVDPWDGAHEELRKEIEADAIAEAKSNALQEEKSQKWPFEE
jgi:hypothetical protein